MYVSDCQFRDGHIVSDYGRPYFVAEVNSSHNGNVEIARKMIDAAAAIGCDCVSSSRGRRGVYIQQRIMRTIRSQSDL